MSKQALKIDAWIREAEEALKLLEDLETRMKNRIHEQQQCRLYDTARIKLMELGVKLDRLEPLLRNPPSKPVLTNEDIDFRWKLLSDIQLRTRTVAISVYASVSENRLEEAPVADIEESSRVCDIHSPDLLKAPICNENKEILKPLLSGEEDKQSHYYLTTILRNVCLTVGALLGVAVLLLLLFFICAILQ